MSICSRCKKPIEGMKTCILEYEDGPVKVYCAPCAAIVNPPFTPPSWLQRAVSFLKNRKMERT